MSAVVGIDLGTTNTVVGVVQGGRAITLANERQERLLPSVVSFHPNGTTLVGREAKERRLIDARNTVYSTKRLIGRAFDSKAVQAARGRAAFELREGPGQATLVVARGDVYTLPEISAFVLREAKRFAEVSLGDSVDRAVITVPANFNDLQRAATKVAGKIAGVEVIRILNEPTAAALAYGYGKGNAERIAIYDFGGGTFDVTLLDLAGNVFEVLATAGDTFLGGDDIDLAIADEISHRFLASHRYDPKAHPQVFEVLLAAAEKLKVLVASTHAPSTHRFHDVVFGPGGKSLELSYTLTPAELARIAAPFVDRTLATCRDAMSSAKLAPSAFEQVILVGGSTRLPIVREKVAEFFGRKPLDRLNPDEVVALGAAIQASALTGSERRRVVAPGTPTAPGLGASPPAPRIQTATNPGMGGAPIAAPRVSAPGPTRNAPPPLPSRSVPARREEATTEELIAAIPELRLDIGSSDEPPTMLRNAGDYLPAGENPFADFEVTKERSLSEIVPEDGIRAPSQAQYGPRGTLVQTGDDGRAAQLAAAVAAAVPRQASASAKAAAGVPPLAPPTGAGPAPRIVQIEEARAPQRAPMAPLLIDVTPLSLSVETAGGWTDVVIERNTPVPCERTRMFTTAADNQSMVRVSVAQGESTRFQENVCLGHVEMVGLRAAARGEVKIAVTFAIDSDGLLGVRAVDQGTGRETSAQIKLGGAVPEAGDVAALAERVRRQMT